LERVFGLLESISVWGSGILNFGFWVFGEWIDASLLAVVACAIVGDFWNGWKRDFSIQKSIIGGNSILFGYGEVVVGFAHRELPRGLRGLTNCSELPPRVLNSQLLGAQCERCRASCGDICMA
jgi:hypothetical protein